MRISVGLLLVRRGLPKAIDAFSGVNGAPPPLFSLIGIAGCLELVLGSMITLGIFTVAAAFLASGQMAVAYFIGDSPQDFWPIMNQGKEAVLYCLVFLYIATRGPGIWSVYRFGTATH